MSEEQTNRQPEETKHPLTFLRILLIISLMWSGWFSISFFFCGVFFDSIEPMIKSFPFPVSKELMEEVRLIAPKIVAAGRWFFLIHGILNGLSCFGASQMWKLRKLGFHFYAISQIAMLITTMIFMKESAGITLPAMLTGICILFYANNLRFMK